MKRFLVSMALLAGLLLLWGAEAQAQSKVTYRDNTKKDKPVVDATGTITKEGPAGVSVKGNISDRSIPAIDVIDIVYEVKPDIRQDYRKATVAETAGQKAAPGSAARKTGLQEALADYQKLLPRVAGVQFVDRQVKYKVAAITALLAADDKSLQKQALAELEKFKKEHADSWQIFGCIRAMSQLYLESGEFAKAAAAYDDLKKLPGISEEAKTDCDLMAADLLVRAKQHAEAGARLQAILAKMAKTNPRYKELELKRILCDASTPPKFAAAIADLRKMATAAKDPGEIALAYNTLGDCYLMNNMAKDAAYEYLYVELIYNQNKEQLQKAITQLVQVFKELKQMDRVKEYSEKLDKLNKPT